MLSPAHRSPQKYVNSGDPRRRKRWPGWKLNYSREGLWEVQGHWWRGEGHKLQTVLLVSKDCKGRRTITAGRAVMLPSPVKKVWRKPSLTLGLSTTSCSANKNGESPRETVNNNFVHWVSLKPGSDPLEKQRKRRKGGEVPSWYFSFKL